MLKYKEKDKDMVKYSEKVGWNKEGRLDGLQGEGWMENRKG